MDPNGSNNTSRPTTTTSGDVYIIPDYNNRNHPAQILVLPFVPHPSSTNAPPLQPPPPPPHYFYTGRSATPSYHDPPPDYETLTPSCSCTTQLTSVADDYGKILFYSVEKFQHEFVPTSILIIRKKLPV